MTLLQTIEHLTYFDYEITFRHEPQHIVLVLKKNENQKESWLPLYDHCYDEKIIQHLNLMAQEIK